MTKAEERKALDRIKKILEDAGRDSYIATALDGAIDLAEQNITEDAAYSTRYYIDKCHAAADDARKAKEAADHDLQIAREKAAEWTKAAVEIKGKWRAAVADAEKAREDKNKAVVRQAELEQEVIRLKAMLFDYMVAEKK